MRENHFSQNYEDNAKRSQLGALVQKCIISSSNSMQFVKRFFSILDGLHLAYSEGTALEYIR